MIDRLIRVGDLEIHVLEWGEQSSPPLLAVHGLGGQASNFIPLAERLSESFHIVAIDLPGRGKSQWLDGSEYHFDTYQDVIMSIIAFYGWKKFRWIGTSMGGCLGMRAAGTVLREHITHLVVNDIGPELYPELLPILRGAVGNPPVVSTLAELADYLKEFQGAMACSPRGDDYWLDTALKGARRTDSGEYTLHYDPAISTQFFGREGDFSLWREFGAIASKIMLIHGMESTFLNKSTVTRMAQVQPTMELLRFEGWGHAPFLDRVEDASAIEKFLLTA